MSEISFSIGLEQLVFFVTVLLGILYQTTNNSAVKTEFRLIKMDLQVLKGEVQSTRIIAQQVAVASSASDNTIENLNITGKLSKALMSTFNVDELKSMAFALEMNGSIEWASKETAVTTILQSMYRKDRLIDVLAYIKEERPNLRI